MRNDPIELSHPGVEVFESLGGSFRKLESSCGLQKRRSTIAAVRGLSICLSFKLKQTIAKLLLAPFHHLDERSHSSNNVIDGCTLRGTDLVAIEVVFVGTGSIRREVSRLYQNCSIMDVVSAIADTRNGTGIANLTKLMETPVLA